MKNPFRKKPQNARRVLENSHGRYSLAPQSQHTTKFYLESSQWTENIDKNYAARWGEWKNRSQVRDTIPLEMQKIQNLYPSVQKFSTDSCFRLGLFWFLFFLFWIPGMRLQLQYPAALRQCHWLRCFPFFSWESNKAMISYEIKQPFTMLHMTSKLIHKLLPKTPPNTILFICFHKQSLSTVQ